MIRYQWNTEKNEWLKRERGISFEQIVLHIGQGDLLAVEDHPHPHPHPETYPEQQLLIVRIADYAYLVPFEQEGDTRRLMTVIPSRKATRDYLGREER